MEATVFARVIWIVLDSVGIGPLPDAADYGDAGRDTLGHIAAQRNAQGRPLHLPNLVRLGLASGAGLAGPVVQSPRGFSLVADGDDLEEAAQAAVERGLRLVGGLWGLDRADAYMLLSMAADLRFGQVALPRVGVWLHLPAQLVGRDPRHWPPGV